MTLQIFFTMLLGMATGVAIIVYHRKIVPMVGMNVWAERFFGAGGTYTLWQLIGVLVCILSLFYGTGTLTNIGDSIVSLLRP